MKYTFAALFAIGVLIAGATIFGVPDTLQGAILKVVVPEPRENATIAQLKARQAVLGAFITEATKTFPKTAAQQAVLTKAQKALSESEDLLSELQSQVREDMPGITATIIKKILDPKGPEPTAIPPQCQLVCK